MYLDLVATKMKSAIINFDNLLAFVRFIEFAFPLIIFICFNQMKNLKDYCKYFQLILLYYAYCVLGLMFWFNLSFLVKLLYLLNFGKLNYYHFFIIIIIIRLIIYIKYYFYLVSFHQYFILLNLIIMWILNTINNNLK